MGKLTAYERKLAHRDGQNVSNLENRHYELESISPFQKIIGQQPVQTMGAKATTDSQVDWVYIGRTQRQVIVDRVQFVQVGPIAAGTQTGEVGLVTTPTAPPLPGETIGTVIAVTNSIPLLTAGNVTNGLLRQNSTVLGCTVPPATHLWAFARFHMTTTQPSLLSFSSDMLLNTYANTSGHVDPVVVGEQLLGFFFGLTTAATLISPYLRIVLRD